MDCLLGNRNDGAAKADNTLDGLKADIKTFGKEVRDHMDNEERFYATPVARKVSSNSMVACKGCTMACA